MFDERRHQGTDERWWFDFAAADGSLGGYVRLAFTGGEAWWWAAVAGTEQVLVAVRAHDLRVPARGTEVRGDGVWAALTCESPLEHWSVGLEAFGAAFDDPSVAEGDERGDVIPFGLDLEWEAVAEPAGGYRGYGQWCEVNGEVLLGEDRLAVASRGWRSHAWGPPPEEPWWRMAVGEAVRCEPGDGGVELSDRGMPARTAGLEVVAVSPVAVPGRRVVHALGRDDAGACGWLSWWGLRPS